MLMSVCLQVVVVAGHHRTVTFTRDTTDCPGSPERDVAETSLDVARELAGAVPNLTYACDTHWPWKTEDVVAGSPFTFNGGALAVPDGPGLGVELDRGALARLHEQYLTCGLRNRDDTGYMRRVVPGYERRQPRW